MQHSPNDIKEKLLRALDKENNVVDMVAVDEVIAILEKTSITRDELERTRLGKYINELRKKTTNEVLAKRAKDLVRRWRKLILPQDSGGGGGGGGGGSGVPTTTTTTLNGERITANLLHHHTGGLSPALTMGHLPGPGPGGGSGGRNKPASPSLLNHHHHHHHLHYPPPLPPQHPYRNVVGSRGRLSPDGSSCSSASTSPRVLVGGSAGRSQSSTPLSFHGFKPISPATKPSTTTTTAIRRPVSSTSPAVFDGGGNKKKSRPVDDDEDDNSCDSRAAAAAAKLSAAAVAAIPHPENSAPSSPHPLLNGAPDGGDSRDSSNSVRDPLESSASVEGVVGGREAVAAAAGGSTTSPPPPTHLAKSKKRGRGSSKSTNSKRFRDGQTCDALKEKLASHLRTPKVKTTAELIQELKARNVGVAAGDVGGGRSAALLAEAAAVDPQTRKLVYSSLLGITEDMTKNKTELMEKFLKDSTFSSSSSSSRLEALPEGIAGPSAGAGRGGDPVDAILASLPPIHPEDIRWEEDEEDDDDRRTAAVVEVTDEAVQRLLCEEWEGVNGNVDHRGEFRRWREHLVRESFDADPIHILPYVDID